MHGLMDIQEGIRSSLIWQIYLGGPDLIKVNLGL
jgi:hypothetical protein